MFTRIVIWKGRYQYYTHEIVIWNVNFYQTPAVIEDSN
jgi:hypothetical protein